MECYCEPMGDDMDSCASVWEVTWHKARKQHRCCECHEPILPGQRYERIFVIFEGTPDSHKTCEFCATEYQRLLSKNPDVMWSKGQDDLACLLVWDMRNEETRSNRCT